MTTEQTKEAIAVMQAYVDGKQIEFILRGPMETWRAATAPLWGWHMYEYRVKPEPWSGKLWVASNGSTLSYLKTDDEKIMKDQGFRLIDVKEVQA